MGRPVWANQDWLETVSGSGLDRTTQSVREAYQRRQNLRQPYRNDSSNWQGEFHKIIVKTTHSGSRLSYRQGYYARPETGVYQKAVAAELEEAACLDLLTSTSLLIVAKANPADQTGKVKYFMAIDPSTIGFASTADGSREVALKFSVCTFDKVGRPIQFMQDAVDQKLTDKQYAALRAQHGYPHALVFTPPPGTAVVRLLVKDVSTGQLGSVNLPYSETQAVTPPATPAPTVNTTPSAPAPN